ncbi:cell division protein FtsK [Deinococcus cavernae]|uniref:Cell division protein FtsK n=1 Tax=Deinococcus cavernae TaxID=2320857 RepID=A0A418V574_9DEIO|nr:DNA translocase FtsK [Deinococcus cavernae]RJF71252.1 cell division protein FtsK [Deinococcus cavernae]
MAKAAKARNIAPQASRFDGEALGLVLFALGILLAVTVFSPAVAEDQRPGTAQAIGFMAATRAAVVGWLGWGAYLLPIIPVAYGVLVFLGRSLRNLTRRVMGGVVVALSLLALHEVVQPGAAGQLAALVVGPVAGVLGYLAALLPLVTLTLGIELILHLAPFALLKTLFRHISILLGGGAARVQGVIESQRGGQESARVRQEVRLGLSAHLRELDTLRRLFPKDDSVKRQFEEVRQARKTVKAQDETGLKHLSRDLDNWQAMTALYVSNAGRDLREAVKVEALDAGADAEALLKDMNAGRHELSVPLASTQASGELEVIRRRAVQDLHRIAFRAGRLERERKAAEKALAKPDLHALGRERAAHEERTQGWQELQQEYTEWLTFASQYPGWPDLAAAFDRAPTSIATTLALALRNHSLETVAQRGVWQQRLVDAQQELLHQAETLTPTSVGSAHQTVVLPVMDFEFAPRPETPAAQPLPPAEPEELLVVSAKAGQVQRHAPAPALGSLDALEDGLTGHGDLDPWDDADDDLPFGPPARQSAQQTTRQPAQKGSDPLKAVPPQKPRLLPTGGVSAAPWESDEPERKSRPVQGGIPLRLPDDALLDAIPAAPVNATGLEVAARQRAGLIDETLRQFNLQARVVDFARGPTVTRYEIEPAPGEKISRISSLSNDLARALAVGGVRIEAPVPGKSVIGLEVPNAEREPVTFHQAADSSAFKNSRAKLPIILGKSIDGDLMVGDLAKMPHLLVAGSTGSGKSVCVNTLITSLLFKYLPTELRFLMVDPKMVELTPYDGIPHLVRGVVTNPVDAAGVLLGAVAHMERRYKMMSQVGAKNLEQFNAKMRQTGEPELPHLVIIIDELADLMITSPKEVESAIMRLAQMARATGMHLILATQRPSVDILTSLIKVNIPARIAFAVSSSHDSRTILDSVGAERLTGMGDMLFYQPGLVKPLRLQGPYISETESVRITEELRRQVFDDTFVELYGADFEGGIEASGPTADKSNMDFSDPYLRQAAQICIEEGQGSVSRLQRRLSVGHARAGKLMDMLEAMGIVSKHQGSKPRDVLITEADLPEYFGK